MEKEKPRDAFGVVKTIFFILFLLASLGRLINYYDGQRDAPTVVATAEAAK